MPQTDKNMIIHVAPWQLVINKRSQCRNENFCVRFFLLRNDNHIFYDIMFSEDNEKYKKIVSINIFVLYRNLKKIVVISISKYEKGKL